MLPQGASTRLPGKGIM